MNTGSTGSKNGQYFSSASLTNAEEKYLSKVAAPITPTVKLTRLQLVAASFFLGSWLFLFAGGITMDTTKFRCAISPGGARALAAEARPGEGVAIDGVCKTNDFWIPSWPIKLSDGAAGFYVLAISWLGLVLFFLPLNLAMVSATSGALGALGNRANLEDEQTRLTSRDESNPIMSGLLRGLFIYLFFISGLLLFDDKPFASPGPGQYIRLAGFLALISFLVNYRPNLFSTISDWAFERINSRKGTREDIRVKKTTEINQEIEVQMPSSVVSTNGNAGKDLAADRTAATTTQ